MLAAGSGGIVTLSSPAAPGPTPGAADGSLKAAPFASVARLAQQLNVSLGAATTVGHGDDVVKLQLLPVTALDTLALIPLPDEHPHSFRNRIAPRGS